MDLGTSETALEHQPSLLRAFENEQHLNYIKKQSSFELLLDEFGKEPRLAISEEILKYWMAQRNGPWHRLSAVADVIFSAPSTQVSVERCFSTFRFILNDQRTRLSDQNLENILLLKSNTNFKMNCDIRFDSDVSDSD